MNFRVRIRITLKPRIPWVCIILADEGSPPLIFESLKFRILFLMNNYITSFELDKSTLGATNNNFGGVKSWVGNFYG